MPYIGKHPSAVPVTVDDIPNNSIDASKIIDGSIQVEDVADNSITDAKLNSTKLDGIDNNANNYSHPSAHTVSEVTGLQSALDAKLPKAGGTMTGDTLHGDNVKAQFGANNDLQIYHDGGYDWVKSSGISLRVASDRITFLKGNTFENLAKFNADSDVELYYDNSLKFETTATGVSVTGDCAATSFSGDGSSLTNLPAGGATNLNGLTDAVYDNSSLGIGINALLNDDGWNINTAVGVDALKANVSGTENTAIGADALTDNTTGYSNTATGRNALYSNTTGSNNVATGRGAMQNTTGGSYNTASGSNALSGNKTGSNNVAVGNSAMFYKTGGHHNVAVGKETLLWNTTGSKNVALGYRAGYNETGSDKLHIANNDTESLIEGDFVAKTLTVNGNVGIGTTSPDTLNHLYHSDSSIKPLLKLQASTSDNTGTQGSSIDFVGASDSTAVGARLVATRVAAGAYMDMRFHTGRDSERMRIDSAGRVTMPYQPAFQASNHSAGNTTGNINYTHTLHNIGGHFNASTGRFTAPTAGMYSFSFHALTQNTVSTGNVGILINGGNPSGNIFRNYMDNSVGKHRPISIGGMFYLNANDYVSIYSPTLILHGNQSEHFSGHLIG